MTRNFSSLLAVVLALFVYCQRGHAQFKQPTAGDSIQDAVKASASDHDAQPATAQHADDTSPTLLADLGGFEFPAYRARLHEVIATNWHHLINSSGRDFRYRSGKTVLEVTIARDGGIRDVRIVQSSDQDDLDAIAMQCISLSNPLPPLPKDFKKKELKMKFNFMFRAAKKPLWMR
jgi:TonB family protein